MPKSLRQLLWETVRDRLRTIRRAAGYNTEMGARFYSWRDLANSPLDQIKPDINPEQNGCFSMRDADCETEQKVSNRMDHLLTIEVQGAVWGTPPDDVARQALADIEKCIGVDRQWTVPDLNQLGGPDVKLALDTRLVSDKINIVQAEERYCVVTKTFHVIFRTSSFNPYAQTA